MDGQTERWTDGWIFDYLLLLYEFKKVLLNVKNRCKEEWTDGVEGPARIKICKCCLLTHSLLEILAKNAF